MKIKTIVRSLVPLISALTFVGAQGATLYVSTQGSDSNPGTSAQPFQTITHAYSQAGPGTTILVAPGVYTDYQSGWGLHLGSSGTASSPIVLQSQVRGGAVIDGQNAADRNEALFIDGNYNVVDGFEIRNGPNGGLTIYGNGNQILNNEIHNNGNPVSTSPNGHDGVYDNEGTTGNVYAGNYVHDNGRAGGSNLDHGLYLCGNNEWVINNVVIRNNSRGLQIAGYTTVTDMKVCNNVFAWNGIDGITVWMAVNGVTIENNILYQNGRYGVEFYAATGGGVVVDHNLAYDNVSGGYSFADGGSTASYTQGTTISADPLFLNETSAAFDAHLNSSSPAIGAGYNLSSYFATDLTGATRSASGPWDVGAYSATVTVPPTIAITAPANGATISGPAVILTAAASDSTGITEVQFQYDGTNLNGPLTISPYSLLIDTTGASNGVHTLTAIAWDAAGNHATSAPVTLTVTNAVTVLGLPAVSVAATSASASRVGPVNGVFTITRTGSIVLPLTVNYSLGGTAKNGSDYAALGTSLTIPAGAADASVTVIPKASANLIGSETATLTFSANPAYSLGVPEGAVTIAGNSVRSAIAKSGNNFRITWASVVGKVYFVACKNSLSDATWTNLSGHVTATTTSTSYTDTSASGKTSRYYIVYVTD